MINIPIKCSIAIIAHNHAMIPPYHANPGRMAFLERTGGSAEWRAALTASHLPFFTFLGFSDLTPGGKVGDRSDLAGNNISSSVANADNGIRMICHRLQHEGGHPVARLRFVFAAVLCLSASVSQATAQDIESLAKQSQNPIANLIFAAVPKQHELQCWTPRQRPEHPQYSADHPVQVDRRLKPRYAVDPANSVLAGAVSGR